MNKKIIVIGIISLFVLSGVAINSAALPTDESNGPMQKLFNRFCDMIGWCRGSGLQANMVNITGIFEYDGTDFFIGEAILHFGPSWYIETAESSVDYDGDGENEYVIDELLGLVDTEITVGAHEQSDNWYSVFTINGEIYREPGTPVWAGTHRWRWRRNQPDE